MSKEVKAVESEKTRNQRTYFFYAPEKGMFLQKDFQLGTGERLSVAGLKKAQMVRDMFKGTQGIALDILEKVG